jgi:acyl carrier protein
MSASTAPETQLAAIFSSLLKRPVAPGEAVERLSEEKWDSLLHIELVFLVEDTFDIAIPAEAVDTLDSSSAILAAVAKLRAA